MKRAIFILLLIFALLRTSCGESVNMGVLTEYQNGDFSAELKIRLGTGESRALFVKRGERLTLSVKEPSALAAYEFALENGSLSIITGGAEIPLAAGELFLLESVFALFSVPVAGTWKIERSRPGGVSIYVCECEGITLYIDANSRLPLKIVSGKAEADVLFFKALAR